MEEHSDGAVVTQCKPSKNTCMTAALGKLARTDRNNLYWFILRRVHDPVESEDLAQQSFVEAIKGVHNFREDSELKTWLYGIASNLVLNHLRRSPRLRYQFESEDILDMMADPAGDPCAQMESRQRLGRLQHHFNALPEEMRETLDMVLLDDASYAGAAKTQGIPVGTIRSRISRGRYILKKNLETEGFEFDGLPACAHNNCSDARRVFT